MKKPPREFKPPWHHESVEIPAKDKWIGIGLMVLIYLIGVGLLGKLALGNAEFYHKSLAAFQRSDSISTFVRELSGVLFPNAAPQSPAFVVYWSGCLANALLLAIGFILIPVTLPKGVLLLPGFPGGRFAKVLCLLLWVSSWVGFLYILFDMTYGVYRGERYREELSRSFAFFLIMANFLLLAAMLLAARR